MPKRQSKKSNPNESASPPDNDAPLVPEAGKPAKEKPAKPRKTDREKSIELLTKEIAEYEKIVMEAALDELAADIAHKDAKKRHKTLVQKVASLKAKLNDPQGHLPLTDAQPASLPGQKELPLDGSPDEWGMVKLTEAKATVDGKRKKLPAGFVENLAGLDPAVTTVTQFEKLLGSQGITNIRGVGQKMVDTVTDWLMAYRQEHPIPHPAPEPEQKGDDAKTPENAAGQPAAA